ncbi:GMC oxidoreductase domain-containing protein [Sarocladium implicatum]|nr:GMC oxidoreductase domain-containing protein [Sarocladium implicatum]
MANTSSEAELIQLLTDAQRSGGHNTVDSDKLAHVDFEAAYRISQGQMKSLGEQCSFYKTLILEDGTGAAAPIFQSRIGNSSPGYVFPSGHKIKGIEFEIGIELSRDIGPDENLDEKTFDEAVKNYFYGIELVATRLSPTNSGEKPPVPAQMADHFSALGYVVGGTCPKDIDVRGGLTVTLEVDGKQIQSQAGVQPFGSVIASALAYAKSQSPGLPLKAGTRITPGALTGCVLLPEGAKGLVVGRLGGAAGCVVASRLADADTSLSILLIESGPDNRNEPLIKHPSAFLAHLQPNKFNKFFHSPPSDKLNGQSASTWVGDVLGGGTSINTMMYTRPSASDLDDWNTPGWSGAEMLPYYNKLEKYRGNGDAAHHGFEGPVEISEGTHVCNKVREDMLRVANEQGWTTNTDLQSMQPGVGHGSAKALRYVSKDGVRQDAATCYLHPRLEDGKHPNLHVLVEAEVVKVIVENGKAVGVEWRSSAISDEGGHGASRVVRARKLVVLSAGAFGSSSILERSGIGSPAILKKAGVPLIQELSGVGRNYMDHTIVVCAYNTDLGPEDTMDEAARSDFEELVKQNSPLLGSNWQDVNIRGRPSTAEIKYLGPAFEKLWRENYAEKLDKPLGWMSMVSGFPGYDPSPERSPQSLGMLLINSYPLSSGHVHITGPSLSDEIDFEAGYLSDEQQLDVKVLVWVYKHSRELMRRMRNFRGEYAKWHPSFPDKSKAAITKTEGPLPLDASYIDYSEEDDAAIEGFIRKSIRTMNHSMGTCKMAPKEAGGVVDPRLSVYGVSGLKVADLSIVPRNVAANTASTAMAIGEKAADLIIEELGLSK